jgi:hypothetical protein
MTEETKSYLSDEDFHDLINDAQYFVTDIFDSLGEKIKGHEFAKSCYEKISTDHDYGCMDAAEFAAKEIDRIEFIKKLLTQATRDLFLANEHRKHNRHQHAIEHLYHSQRFSGMACGMAMHKAQIIDMDVVTARKALARLGAEGKAKKVQPAIDETYRLVRERVKANGKWKSRQKAVEELEPFIAKFITDNGISIELGAYFDDTLHKWLRKMPDAAAHF